MTESKFFKLPKALSENSEYSKLDNNSKLLYAFMLDRRSLSEMNKWRDKKGIYIYYSIDEICSALNCGHNKAIKCVNELENSNLLSKERTGCGKPTKLYIHMPYDKNETPENEGRFSVIDEVKNQIGYFHLKSCCDTSILDCIVLIICDIYMSDCKKIKIGSNDYPADYVKQRFKLLKYKHISKVINNMSINESIIMDDDAYILTTLFNAPRNTIKTDYSVISC